MFASGMVKYRKEWLQSISKNYILLAIQLSIFINKTNMSNRFDTTMNMSFTGLISKRTCQADLTPP